MTAEHSRLTGLERALAELVKVFDAAPVDRNEVPFYGPTMLQSTNKKDQAMAVRSERARHKANPEDTAVHFCLTSAIALLEVSQVLLNRSESLSPQDRERQWKTLVAYTKTAGRSAYRAASMLTDQKD